MEVDSNNTSGSDSEEGGEAGVAAEPLATTRSRRTNAGNRMSKIIQDEEDEFYTNLYGGFNEEEDDIDFDSDEENDYDSFESDFSIDETDDIAPEHQAVDEDEPKKRNRVYKDPKPKGYSSQQSSGPSAGVVASTPNQSRPKASSSANRIRGERSFRDSTRKKTEQTIKNIQTDNKKRKKIKNRELWSPLSQEEMLEEAKKTEEENIKSLENYQRLESEKLERIKQVKKTLPPPYTTYLSTTMPIIGTNKKYSRNFLTINS